ncbi:MAG: hypothetical protein HN948_05210 [Clostridia bacterium]|jgi:uroporphyrinogen decarboxylase|nr:hypothetical protein [Clostridia bacterium]MBT7122391.1 hypothetical protein [Clostridia bacterium]
MSNIILDTLQGKKTDRVPVAPFINVNYIDEFYGEHNMDRVAKSIEVYKHFGFDIIFRNSTVNYLDETALSADNWKVTSTRTDISEGDHDVLTVIETPEKQLRQIKQYRTNTPFEVVEACVEYYIKDASDFAQFVKYQPPVPVYDCSDTARAREIIGDTGCIAPWGQGVFNMVSMHRKLDDLLIDPYLNRAFYGDMMRYFGDRMLEVIKQYKANGADMVSCGGNVAAGGVVGADYFAEHILPFEAKFFGSINELGLYSIYHNCGDASHLLPLYPQIGMSMLESLTPAPYGDTDLAFAMDTIPKNITLSGGFDQITLLREGSAKQIRSKVMQMMDILKKRGNFIFATTDYFNENTPEDNVFEFARAAHDYGQY